MSVFKEFKDFAMKGNLVDMAIAFVMGASFGKLVTAFNEGMIMPVIGKLTAGIDFKDLKFVLSPAEYDAAGKVTTPEAAIRYGEFVSVCIDFLLVAFVMFLVVRFVNRVRTRNAAETAKNPPAPTKEEILLTEIRDALRAKG